jgi:antitoxin YefM
MSLAVLGMKKWALLVVPTVGIWTEILTVVMALVNARVDSLSPQSEDLGNDLRWTSRCQYCTVLLYKETLMISTTYSQARQNLAALLDQVAQDREIAVIKRRGCADVALVAADELSSLLETAHLLRAPANAKRLLTALQRAQSKKLPAKSLADLRSEFGLDGQE